MQGGDVAAFGQELAQANPERCRSDCADGCVAVPLHGPLPKQFAEREVDGDAEDDHKESSGACPTRCARSAFTAFGIGPGMDAEAAVEYEQKLISSLDLPEQVPEAIRNSF